MSIYEKYHPASGAARPANRFPAAGRLALLFDVMGWSAAILAIAVAVLAAAAGGWAIGPALPVLAYGLFISMVLLGQAALIRVVLAIEQNTRDCALAMREQSRRRLLKEGLAEEEHQPGGAPS